MISQRVAVQRADLSFETVDLRDYRKRPMVGPLREWQRRLPEFPYRPAHLLRGPPDLVATQLVEAINLVTPSLREAAEANSLYEQAYVSFRSRISIPSKDGEDVSNISIYSINRAVTNYRRKPAGHLRGRPVSGQTMPLAATNPVTLSQPTNSTRAIAVRTHGRRIGPVTRLVSPTDIGQLIKPFVFLDGIAPDGIDPDTIPDIGKGFGWHPHSGIATVSLLFDGTIFAVDSTGMQADLESGAVDWFMAGGGAWHGGKVLEPVGGYQLWVAMPPELENAPARSRIYGPEHFPRKGPVRVILGTWNGIESPIPVASPMIYLDVMLKAGETWRFEPPQGYEIAWLAVHSGELLASEPVDAGELVVFEEAEAPVQLDARQDTRLVFGAAVKHPYDLGWATTRSTPAPRLSQRAREITTTSAKGSAAPQETYRYLVQRLSMLRLAYLHLARTRSAFDYRALARPLFNGPLLLSAGLDRDSAASLIAQRAADAAVFGSLYLANPDLLQRFAVGAPLNAPDRETFYSDGPRGYVDYPVLRQTLEVGQVDWRGAARA